MDGKERVTLKTGKINAPAYVDDVAIMVEDEKTLKRLMTGLEKYVEEKVLKINTSKTKTQTYTKREGRRKK